MKVLPKISVTTTETRYQIMGKRFLLCQSGTSAVNIGFSYVIAGHRTTDMVQIPLNTPYRFTAPKGHLFYQIFVSTDSGTSTLDVVASDINVELVD